LSAVLECTKKQVKLLASIKAPILKKKCWCCCI